MHSEEETGRSVSRSASPLRYPGGKACLYNLAIHLMKVNGLHERSYVEPYSGGCGLALSLLFSGHVTQVHLNDLDRSVWAFWKTVVDHTDEFVGRIATTEITVAEWERQRVIQTQKDNAEIIDLGFSTFFLNRTNRSGIIHSGGIIGGKSQDGLWKMDCRFNKPDLIKRIKRVAQYRNRIKLYNEDAEVFLNRVGATIPNTSLIYIDPPYHDKGSLLYRNSYRPGDHSRIAQRLASLDAPWFMTYDNVKPIRELYDQYPQVELDIGYSMQTKRRGSELLLAAKELKLPFEIAAAH